MSNSTSKTQPCCSKSITNVLLLGFGFMFSMGSYLTTAISQTVILNSVKEDYFNGTSTIGYSVLCVGYGSTAVSFLIAPTVSAVVGPKIAMVGGSAFLLLYVVMFLRPLAVTLYIGSVMQGFGQGLIWTTYGHFLVDNSTKKTIGRNTGIFWCIFCSNLVFGNLFYFFLVRGATEISGNTRTIIFSVLISSAAIGTVAFALLRHPWIYEPPLLDPDGLIYVKQGPLDALKGLCGIMMSKNMILLMPTFMYMGLDLSFYINVYGTSLGYTKLFGNIRESLVGLNGVFVGIGQILGGVVFGLLGRFSHKHGRDPALVFGFIVHLISFYLVYLNLPPEAPLFATSQKPILGPNAYLAMGCSFLLGLGDAAWNNQLFQLLGTLYPNQSVAAFALFQFVQCLTASGAFYYTTLITLPYHLIILTVVGLFGVAGFCLVEWKSASLEKQKLRQNGSTPPTELHDFMHQEDRSTPTGISNQNADPDIFFHKRHVSFQNIS